MLQDKRVLQQQLASEATARKAAEQKAQTLQRDISSTAAECSNCRQDCAALQQQLATVRQTAQEQVLVVQKQLGDALAERDVAADQLKAAEQQAAAEIGQRVRVDSQLLDLQQQLSRQTAEAAKAHETCKKLNEKVCAACCKDLRCCRCWSVRCYPSTQQGRCYDSLCSLHCGAQL